MHPSTSSIDPIRKSLIIQSQYILCKKYNLFVFVYFIVMSQFIEEANCLKAVWTRKKKCLVIKTMVRVTTVCLLALKLSSKLCLRIEQMKSHLKCWVDQKFVEMTDLGCHCTVSVEKVLNFNVYYCQKLVKMFCHKFLR